MAAVGDVAELLYRGAYDAKHSLAGVYLGQVDLLDGAQGLGRGGVAGEDDERAAHVEEGLDGL